LSWTVSEFSRRELQELLHVDAHVVPGGVDHRFRPDADPEPAKAALGLTRPYVLTVASRTARKNLASLSATSRRLQAEGIDLVAAGGERPQFRTENEAAGPARALGHVPDAHLPGLYAGASAFVLPSWHEGFGLTCLEAMACGVPGRRGRPPAALPRRAATPRATPTRATPTTSPARSCRRSRDDALVPRAGAAPRGSPWERTTAELHALLSGRRRTRRILENEMEQQERGPARDERRGAAHRRRGDDRADAPAPRPRGARPVDAQYAAIGVPDGEGGFAQFITSG
jgi:hypothetical protein